MSALLRIDSKSVTVRVYRHGVRVDGQPRPYSITEHGDALKVNVNGQQSPQGVADATAAALAFLYEERAAAAARLTYALPVFVPLVGGVE